MGEPGRRAFFIWHGLGMDAEHIEEHIRLRRLEQAALGGSYAAVRTWRVALRVHLADWHGLEGVHDPVRAHAGCHEGGGGPCPSQGSAHSE